MRRAALLAVALLLAAAATVNADTYPKVSGTYGYEVNGAISTVTLDAEADGLGSGTFTFSRPGVSMAGDVACVSIHKQDAMVWGVVTEAVGTDATIWGTWVHDGGLPGGEGDLAMSFAAPGVELPAKCNIPPAWGSSAKYLVPITAGDIVID